MANTFYAKGAQGILNDTIQLSTDDIVVLLVDTADYTANFTTDEFIADIPGAAIVATGPALASKTFTNGAFDAAEPYAFGAVSGDVSEALVIAQDTGNTATSRLILYIDTTGNASLPITPDGGDINIDTWGTYIFSVQAC